MDITIFYLTAEGAPNQFRPPVVASAVVEMYVSNLFTPDEQIRDVADRVRVNGVTIALGPHTFRDPVTGVFTHADARRWIPPSAIIGVQILTPSRDDHEERLRQAEERARAAAEVVDRVQERLRQAPDWRR